MTDLPACAYESIPLGNVRLQSGEILRDAALAYVTLGTLNRARDNAIVLPTYYTGQHTNYFPLIGPGKGLDPERYFIVIPNMFGNGLSSSPSNYSAGASGESFPRVTVYDNVVHQARLVFDHLQVAELALVCGWSMGGIQAYQWAALYPERVRRLLPYGSAARISPYNRIFLDGLKAALQADCNWREDRCPRPPEKGLRAFARVYAGWAYSEVFFREGLFQELGYSTQEALLKGWEEEHLRFDANDLIAMLTTWQCADISANETFDGSLNLALGAIRARTMLIPCSTDRYFSALENRREALAIADCEIRILKSPFGHCALSPGRVPSAMAFLDRCLTQLLAS